MKRKAMLMRQKSLSEGNVEWVVPTLPVEERDRRYELIRQEMKKVDIECLIVAGHQGNYGDRTANFRYVANYAPWFDDEYIIFPREGNPAMVTFLVAHASWARRISWIQDIRVTTRAEYVNVISSTIRELGLGKGAIGICDYDTMPASIYTKLREALPEGSFVDAEEMFSQIRMVKSASEIQFMEKAAEIADIGFRAMLAASKAGIRDTELFTACEKAMTDAGAEPPSFTVFSSSPSFSAKGFGLPYAGCGRKLQEGDMILNEISPSYGGYWAQLCEPIVIGKKIPEDLKKVVDIHQEMYLKALEIMKPGITVESVNSQVRELAFSMGSDRTKVSETWILQHIGLRIIDKISPKTVLRENMTFVAHPLTQHEGNYGGHTIGNTVAITKNGCRVLSEMPLKINHSE
jgi:Xaa-Pro dipeptidase